MLDKKNIRSDEELVNSGFSKEDIEDFHRLLEKYSQFRSSYVTAELDKNFELSISLEEQMAELELVIVNRGSDPKTLSKNTLLGLAHAPRADTLTDKFRARIKNRATAMRAFCVTCQGGDTVGVRECQSVSCPLWPFRLGRDPLRGYEPLPQLVLQVTANEEVEPEEIEPEEVEEDDADTEA